MTEQLTPELAIERIKQHDAEGKELRNALIEEHFGFVVQTISKVTGRYVEIENNEELSIGLMAFDEAIERYDASRGASFLTYAHLVISSRIKDYFKKANQDKGLVSIEEIHEEARNQLSDVHKSQNEAISEEVQEWESILIKFGFDLEHLADETPKHEDTRNNAIDLSEKISGEKDIVHKMYEKYKLPIAMIVLRIQTTKKIVKHSKKFIIATVVVFTKNFGLIRRWVYKDKKGYTA